MFYESSRTFEKVHTTWGAGFSLPGRAGRQAPGVPKYFFYFSRRRRRRAKERKRFFGGTPNPGLGLAPSALPLEKHVERAFLLSKPFGMTHILYQLAHLVGTLADKTWLRSLFFQEY